MCHGIQKKCKSSSNKGDKHSKAVPYKRRERYKPDYTEEETRDMR